MTTRSRYYYRNYNTLEVDVINLFGSFILGAAGAVSSFQGGGIKSITKLTTAGQYEIELTERFARILMINSQVMGAAISGVAAVQVLETPATFQASVKADGKITIQCVDKDGAAVNPASGEALYIDLKARQSKIGRYDK